VGSNCVGDGEVQMGRDDQIKMENAWAPSLLEQQPSDG